MNQYNPNNRSNGNKSNRSFNNSVRSRINNALSSNTDSVINLIYDLGDQQYKQAGDAVRYGQCIANSALGVIPDAANAIRGSSVDCYYRDENILSYMDAIRDWINLNHDFKKYSEDIKAGRYDKVEGRDTKSGESR